MKYYLLKHRQVLLFILAGGLSAIMEVGSFKIFSIFIPQFFPAEQDLLGVHFPFSNIFSTTAGIISNYFFSIWFVFERGKHSRRKEFVYFLAVSAVSTVLSLTFFQMFFRFIFINNFVLGPMVFSPQIMSKIASIALVSVLNYSVKKRLIFNG